MGAGRATVLNWEDELELEQCLIARAKMGYPCDKRELLDLVGNYVHEKGIANPFRGGKPGQKWYKGFMNRHPTLSLKKPEQIQKVRITSRDPLIIFLFFDTLESLYKECGKNVCSVCGSIT